MGLGWAGPQDDPDFFISKWTPQAELLQDPAVKAVITHCGWGGTLESWLALLAPHLFSFPFHRLPLLSYFFMIFPLPILVTLILFLGFWVSDC